MHVARLYGRVEIQPHKFITSVVGGELSVSRPGHFTLEERVLGTAGIVGRVGPGNGLGALQKRQIFASTGNGTKISLNLE